MGSDFRLGVLVSGRGSNMSAIIEACQESRIDASVVVVISDKKDARALQKAKEKNIEVLHFREQQQMTEALLERKIDLVCLAGFMQILRKPILDVFSRRIVNIHPSLLPKFPGLNTHQRVIDAKEKESGCTIHYVDEGVDTGEIILQARIPVGIEDTEETLAKRVLKEEHRAYPIAIQRVLSNMRS
ncbi:phosphoribosylglycinamide formyltransferase [PVC group bacterium (ex Bugula neritina AB1)]|nr:phosphoribosylglycinamide formyltransferase [PVC group bacterium (ex Bugula neritina AB1)]